MIEQFERSLQHIESLQAGVAQSIQNEDWSAVADGNAAIDAGLGNLFLSIDEHSDSLDRDSILALVGRLELVLQQHKELQSIVNGSRSESSTELTAARRGRKAAGDYLDTAGYA